MSTESWMLTNASPLTWTLCALIAILSIWIFIRQLGLHRGDTRAVLLEILRLIIAGLIIVTLLAPEKVRRSRTQQDPMVAVLIDESGSTDTRDVPDGDKVITRKEWLNSLRKAAPWEKLKEAGYKLAVESFGAPATDDDDPGTDINAALEGLLERHRNLRAVVLISDGDWNKGKAPTTAASVMQGREIPLYGLVTGSDRFLPDLDLEDVKAPTFGLVDESISLPFTIQSRMPSDVKTRVELLDENGVIESKDITIPSMSQFQDSIVLEPHDKGTYNFRLRVPIAQKPHEESFKDNNEIGFSIDVRQEILKVLVIDSFPRWEYRYLRNALSRDPGVEVSCLLFHPGKMKMGGGADYITEFPKDRDELSKFDVVFLGDVGADQLDEEELEMLKGLVEQQGSGLVFLPGLLGEQGNLNGSTISEINPVIMKDEDSEGYGSKGESRLQLTSRGRGHLLTLLAADADQNYALWKKLPGFYWYANVKKAKPGSTVLAVHENAREEYGRVPLLVTRTAGNGKTLFMGTDAAWRWRRGVEDKYHYRFWGQVVRWMAHQRHLATEEGIRFFFSPETPRRGEPVFLHATVFNRNGFPLEEGSVQVTIEDGKGGSEVLELEQEEGGWGVFTGNFVPRSGGAYKATVVCDEADRRLEDVAINVEATVRERIGRPAKINVMRELSNITRGKWYGMDGMDELINKVSLLPESRIQEERFQLWSSLPWAGLIVLLLTLYWVGRKLLGLI